MSIHAWRILAGAIRIIFLYLSAYFVWFVISSFDEKWNVYVWSYLFHREIAVLGFLSTILLFYLVGGFSETKIGAWIDKKISKIPIIGRWIVIINPQVRELI